MNTLETIEKRRSYRGRYRPEPVPREDLETVMRAGLAAPSGCNMQTASLIAVDDPAVLEQIRRAIDPPVGETAPAAICVLTRRVNAYRDKCFAVQDYAAAIENMLLAIEELGYRSCWFEGHITDADGIGRRIARILGVPESYELVCFLPVGIAEEEAPGPAKRGFAERAWFNRFPEREEERCPRDAPAQEKPAPLLSAVHHIAIIVSDYAAARDFYVGRLGFPVIRENYRPERKDWKLDLQLNPDTELEIFAPEDPPKRLSRPEACGLRHLAFFTADIEETVRRLEDLGIPCEPIRSDSFTGRRMTFFHDPDGLPLELHE